MSGRKWTLDDFFATIQVRALASGAPVTDFVKTEVLLALEHASTNPDRRYLVFLDELNRCQETARNALMPALDSTRRVFHPIGRCGRPMRPARTSSIRCLVGPPSTTCRRSYAAVFAAASRAAGMTSPPTPERCGVW